MNSEARVGTEPLIGLMTRKGFLLGIVRYVPILLALLHQLLLPP